MEKVPYKKEKIPAAVRNALWNTYMGDKKTGYCYVGCGEIISTSTMEAGHIHAEAEGGETTLENLRPICSMCNKSMGKTNMMDFIKKYKFNSPILKEVGSDFVMVNPTQNDILAYSTSSTTKLNDDWKSFGWDECIFSLRRLNELGKINIDINTVTKTNKCKEILSKYSRSDDYLRAHFNSFTKKQLIETKLLKDIIKDDKTKSKKFIVDKLILEYDKKETYYLNIGQKDTTSHRCIIS